MNDISDLVKRVNGCAFVYRTGPKRGDRCNEGTSEKFCAEHKPKYTGGMLIQSLLDNPYLTSRLMEMGSFYATHHRYKDCYASEEECCDDCYSDNEDDNDDIVMIMKQLFESMNLEDGSDSSDDVSSDEDSSE